MTPPSVPGVADQRIDQTVPLMTPALLHHELPLPAGSAQRVIADRQAVVRVLNGVDDRLLVVVGPCSVHDPQAALAYAGRLREAAARLADDLLVVMRVYFEKPRTTVGWKGLIYDPTLDGAGDVNTGLRTARSLLLRIVGLGLPVGCEFLDTITPQYIADTVSWGAIGARTVESQVHRQLASGMSMPVGMKNRPDGAIDPAVDAVVTAGGPHVFPGIAVSGLPAVLHTRGNEDCHLILRGGRGAPNYHAAAVAEALRRLAAAGLPERVLIDASHDNSGKDHERQALVAVEVAAQVGAGQRGIRGVMLESFLEGGRQDPDPTRPLRYGQSITDACLSWAQTESVLAELASASATRRTAAAAV
ncbi:MAG: 3-deoxy-7-phosphoheptulonate synthase [Catenulispora sp. 13_1_20CM_3_70_7]|nr:MAG: 3-deoxy-7-phosphoheptulonate synthase [Catenulispora sp. 13_1_20CM_3_70_7]